MMDSDTLSVLWLRGCRTFARTHICPYELWLATARGRRTPARQLEAMFGGH